MKPKNFPGRKQQRRIVVLQQLEMRPLRDKIKNGVLITIEQQKQRIEKEIEALKLRIQFSGRFSKVKRFRENYKRG